MKKIILWFLFAIIVSPFVAPFIFYCLSFAFYHIGDLLDIYVAFLGNYFIEESIPFLLIFSFLPVYLSIFTLIVYFLVSFDRS